MRLSDYMDEHGLSDEKLAKRLRVTRPTVSRIRRGVVIPKWPTIRLIERVTGGLVTANDFLEPERARAS